MRMEVLVGSGTYCAGTMTSCLPTRRSTRATATLSSSLPSTSRPTCSRSPGGKKTFFGVEPIFAVVLSTTTALASLRSLRATCSATTDSSP